MCFASTFVVKIRHYAKPHTVGANSKNMRVNLKRIIPLLAIIGLLACNENSKPNSENSSLDSQTSDLKSENTHISEEFNWNIINSEKDEPYFDTYSLIQFTYQGKEYRMDTLNSHVSPCDLVDSAIEEPCSSLKNSGVLGAYFGANAGIFCYGQIIEKGDSLEYRHWCVVEEDEEQLLEKIVDIFKKKK